jgi:hypothetical protein
MAIDGAWGVVYWGEDMVLGIGAFIIDRDGELRGRDYGGVGYSGTAKEDKDGTITLDIKMSVPAGVSLVQGDMPMHLPIDRLFSQTFPPRFNNGEPYEIKSVSVCVVIKPVPYNSGMLKVLGLVP